MTTFYPAFAAGGAAGVIELRCLELIHSTFPDPLRFVDDYRDWTVTLESGEQATFLRTGFQSTPPGLSTDGRIQRTITLNAADPDGEGFGSIVEDMRTVIRSGEPMVCLFRYYLSSDLSAPQFTPPERTTVSNAVPGRLTLQLTCDSQDVYNKAFPGLNYTTDNAPGLKR